MSVTKKVGYANDWGKISITSSSRATIQVLYHNYKSSRPITIDLNLEKAKAMQELLSEYITDMEAEE